MAESGLGTDNVWVARIKEREDAMKIGARNRLEGKVTEIKKGTVMCQVKVEVAGGAIMESVMTLDSLAELGLVVGDKVRVAVKAVNVMLIKD
jgi:molybdopterin-binding protein